MKKPDCTSGSPFIGTQDDNSDYGATFDA